MSATIPDWAKLIIPPLLTVSLGGFLVQRFFVRRANQAAFIDHLIEELVELRNESLDYWSKSTADDNRAEIKQLEGRMKGRIHSLVADLNYFRSAAEPLRLKVAKKIGAWMPVCLKRFLPDGEAPTYVVSMLEVYDACTGDGFESEPHLEDATKYFSICSKISTVKSELLRIKL